MSGSKQCDNKMEGGSGVRDEVGILQVRWVHGLLALFDPHLFFPVNWMTQKRVHNGMLQVRRKSIGSDSAPAAPVLPNYAGDFFHTEIGSQNQQWQRTKFCFFTQTFRTRKIFTEALIKFLYMKPKKLDHLLWWFAINIYIHKKVIKSTSFNRIYLEIKIMFHV